MVDLGFPLFPLLTKKSGSYIIYIIVILTTRTYVYGTCIPYTVYYILHDSSTCHVCMWYTHVHVNQTKFNKYSNTNYSRTTDIPFVPG